MTPVEQRRPAPFGETCVLLAGGAGTRLRSRTGGGNKHLLAVDGEPLLWHVLSTILRTRSVKKLVVITRPDSVADVGAILERARPDASCQICLRVQSRPQGTLDAVMTAGGDIDHASFVVHYGDNLFGWRALPPPTGLALRFAATVYAVSPPKDWRRYGLVNAAPDGGDRLVAVGVWEKPSTLPVEGRPYTVTGCMRFETETFWRTASLVGRSPGGEFELTSLVGRLVEWRRVSVVPVSAPWVDCGTEEGLGEAARVIDARERKSA